MISARLQLTYSKAAKQVTSTHTCPGRAMARQRRPPDQHSALGAYHWTQGDLGQQSVVYCAAAPYCLAQILAAKDVYTAAQFVLRRLAAYE